jgi:WD40 repeat protein
MDKENYKYNAFISYLQVPDKRMAIAIRKGLMELGAKKYLLKFRALNVFRDETDLAGRGTLSQRIQFGIDNSEYLILLGRPEVKQPSSADKKNWVQEEIEYWLTSKFFKNWPIKNRIEDTKIIICVLEGNVKWGSEDFLNDEKNCLNEILKGVFSGEPKWIDFREISQKIRIKSESETANILSLRDPNFLQKVAEISGQIQNKSVDELIADDRKRQLLWSNLLIASLIFMIILIGFACYEYADAIVERNNVQNQLARNYWNNSHFDRNENNLLEALHYSAEAIAISKDDGLTTNLLMDIQSLLPRTFLRQILSHDAAVYSAMFSPGGTMMLTISYDSTIRLWDVNKAIPIGTPMKHQSLVLSAVFSRDGTKILTETNDSTVNLWDVKKDTLIKHQFNVQNAVFSPDGTKVLSTSYDSTVRLWDAIKGKPIGTPIKHPCSVLNAAFSLNETKVLTVTDDGTVRLLDINTSDATVISKLIVHKDTINVSYTSNGTEVVTELRPERTEVVKISPNTTKLVTISWDGTARLWDTKTGHSINVLVRNEDHFYNPVTSADFSSNGKKILTIRQDGTIFIWNGETGDAIGQPIRHEPLAIGTYGLKENVVSSAVFSLDGTKVLTACKDGMVRLWDADTGNLISTPLKHKGAVYSAVFCSHGAHILTTTADGTIHLYDVKDSVPISIAMKHQGDIFSSVFSPDHTKILTASRDGTARLWDAKTGAPISTPILHKGAVHSAVFSPNGTEILTACEDQTARLWNAKSLEPIKTIMAHKNVVFSAVFSPNGAKILTACRDGTARLWDAKTGNPIDPLISHKGAVHSAVFSPDGAQILTASWDSTARLWDAKSLKPIGIIMKHASKVYSAVFNPKDVTKVLTACEDGAHIWDTRTGTPVCAIINRKGIVYSACFSPDGLKVITASWDGNCQIWDAKSGAAIGNAIKSFNTAFSAIFNPDGTKVITGDHSAHLLDVEGDMDIPADLLKLEIKVATGTKLNVETGETNVISKDEWYRLMDEYTNKAKEHYKTCKYSTHNFWKLFFPEEAKKISAFLHHN